MTIVYSSIASDMGKPRLAAVGHWLRRHQRAIRWAQWGIILVYAVLLITPTLMPLPGNAAHIWNNATVFAQFVFWGIWWPGVLISILLFGRLWCGILCPEGALSEIASSYGRGYAIPGWIRWPGWPFAAFIMTTVYGQMVSVYQYPAPALLILGGSTVAAISIGYLYGRNHRVWCRYLCPVTGVFGLLSKLSPIHYKVDQAAWNRCPPALGPVTRVNCAPLVPLRTMQSASPCHMCGRCSGFRDAIELTARAPGIEVIEISGETANKWDSALILVGLMGVAVGAFHWASSPWFVMVKQWLAMWLVEHNMIWPLTTHLPWWMLTNVPENGDVLNLLDGAVMLLYIGLSGLVMACALTVPLAMAVRVLGPWHWQRFHHLTQAVLPMAACGLILGLSAQTVTLLRADAVLLPHVQEARAVALVLAGLWSMLLIWRISGRYGGGPARVWASLVAGAAVCIGMIPWLLLFFLW